MTSIEEHMWPDGKTLKDGFNTEYTQRAMQAAYEERCRQVELGKAGKIIHACENPDLSWGYRLGVLCEEVGEISKELIEECPYSENMLRECIQTAAVALACTEAVMRKRGISPYTGLQEGDGADGTDYAEGEVEKPESEHMAVLLRANAIHESRNSDYKDAWREYGARGALTHFRTCAVRAWNVFFGSKNHDKAVDNLIDAINYAVFAIRNIEENAKGDWNWGEE